MKILALEKEIGSPDWQSSGTILKNEAKHVYTLYLASIIREIYFTDQKNAVLILEAQNKQEAYDLLQEFPLFKNGFIQFDIFELHPYTGLDRIIAG